MRVLPFRDLAKPAENSGQEPSVLHPHAGKDLLQVNRNLLGRIVVGKTLNVAAIGAGLFELILLLRVDHSGFGIIVPTNIENI